MGLFSKIQGTTFNSFGIKDTNLSHLLNFTPGSNLTADRVLTFTTGDADRTITLSGNPTLNDWFDQSVKTTASPTFAAANITGKVGIGTTSVGSLLHIKGTASDPAFIKLESNTTTDDPKIRFYRTGAEASMAADIFYDSSTQDLYIDSYYDSNDGDILFRTRVAGTPISALTIKGSGKVGIGTTAPSKLLEISGDNATSNFKITGLLEGTAYGSLTGLTLANGNGLYFYDSNVYLSETGNVLTIAAASGTNITSSAMTFGSGSTITWTMNVSSGDPVLTWSPETLTTSSLSQIFLQSQYSFFYAQRFSADASGAIYVFDKSRHATAGSHTIVQNGDTLGSIYFRGSSGSAFASAAQIQAYVDGTPGASGDMPGRLSFSTSADGSSSPTERMRIDSAGNFTFGSNTSFTMTMNAGATDPVLTFGSATVTLDVADFYIRSADTIMYVQNYKDSAYPGYVIFEKSRNATIGNHTIVTAGDQLGAILFRGSNGSAFVNGAAIRSYCETGVGTGNDMPSCLTFDTAADGTASLVERMRITSAGCVLIGTTAGTTKLNIAPDSGTGGDPANYGRGLQITRAASNTGQHISLIRSGTCVYSLGYAYGTSYFAIGGGQSTDSNFTATGSAIVIGGGGVYTQINKNSIFRAYASADNIGYSGNGTAYTVVLDAETVDVGSNFNTATYKFVAPVTGYYHFDGAVLFYDAEIKLRICVAKLYKNGSIEIDGEQPDQYYYGGAWVRSNVSGIIYLAASDYVTLGMACWTLDSGTYNQIGGPGNTYLHGFLISAVY